MILLLLSGLLVQDVESLVRRLGTEAASEREAAVGELLKVGEKARPALVRAAGGGDAEIAARAREILEKLDRETLFDGLVAEYRRHGLPMPPADATLVTFRNGWQLLGEPEPYSLGFRMGPGAEKGVVRVLAGTSVEEIDAADRKVAEFKPDGELPPGLLPQSSDTFPLNARLATAIQCRARGWTPLARSLLGGSLEEEIGDDRSEFHQPAGLSPKSALAVLAFVHFGNAIAREGSDRADLARRMKALAASEPKLDTKPVRFLLRSLDAAVETRPAPAGSVEALIDGLVDAAGYRMPFTDREPDPRYLRVLERGFEAVPVLIEHLDDIRLTRQITAGFSFGWTSYDRVGDLAERLLYELGPDLQAEEWMKRDEDWSLDKKPLRDWWEKEKKGGEEKYLLDRAVPAAGDLAVFPDAILRLLGKKYPQRLKELHRELLDHKKAGGWPLSARVAESALSKEDKIALLKAGAVHANWFQRQGAIYELRALDPVLHLTMLLKGLADLPVKPPGGHANAPESYFGNLVLELEEPRAWEGLRAAVRRADPAFRIEILSRLYDDDLPDAGKRRVRAFLAEFLDDASVREQSVQGLMAADHARLEVRNLAALRLSQLLGVREVPRPDWTSDQWADLRAKVRQALKR